MKRPVLLAMSMGFFVPAALAACDEKSIAPAAARIDAGADKYATADPKLTRALLAAESASGSSDNGPPPDGIFGRGVADRRHPKGKPTTIELLGDGSEPRVTLAGNATADAIRAADYGPAALRIVEQRGRMARPTVDFTFAVGPAKKDDGGTDWLVATVK